MATMPTDEALDQTVGVDMSLQPSALNRLKREALLFDQIVIPTFGLREDSGPPELRWLRDLGIVRPVHSPWIFDDPMATRQHLAAIGAETGEPIDVMAIPDERLANEVSERIFEARRRKPHVMDAVHSRMLCVNLRLDGFNAFPIFETRRQSFDMFPSGTTPVLEVVLKSMPMPDDQTPWEDIIEFRKDPDSKRLLRRLRVWVRKFAKATTATSLAEMKEESSRSWTSTRRI